MATEQLIALQYGERLDGASENGSIGLESEIDSWVSTFSLTSIYTIPGNGNLYINLLLNYFFS